MAKRSVQVASLMRLPADQRNDLSRSTVDPLRALGCLALVLFLVPAASAAPLPPPPQDLHGTPTGDGNVTLTWYYEKGKDVVFHVYDAGMRIASTYDLNITLPIQGFYYVTAEDNGTESPPSNPWPWPLSEFLPPCAIAGFGVDLETPPFVAVVPDEGCIDAYYRMIEDLT